MKLYLLRPAICVMALLALSPSTISAGNRYNGSFMDIGTKQGWFILNDYETSMNPPACILRNPTPVEYKALLDFCKGVNDTAVNCDNQINDFLSLWAKNNCQTLGMKVRTLPDGSLRSYFPPKPTAEITQSSSPTPRVRPTTDNQLQEVQQQLQKKREFNYLEITAIAAAVAIASIVIYNRFFSKKH